MRIQPSCLFPGYSLRNVLPDMTSLGWLRKVVFLLPFLHAFCDILLLAISRSPQPLTSARHFDCLCHQARRSSMFSSLLGIVILTYPFSFPALKETTLFIEAFESNYWYFCCRFGACSCYLSVLGPSARLPTTWFYQLKDLRRRTTSTTCDTI
ncbi:hypothetical protein C8J56DRAFT_37861 [Mycena floridula]|nr:hypothetical protein C8J56DRAFT_37861 [Mycena floridula]